MPTVILLDVSLSMSRPVVSSEPSEECHLHKLAVHGINTFLDYLAAHCKLEFTSLVIFSSLWEQVVPFTRDFESVRKALGNVEVYDKTCLATGLNGASTLLMTEWGSTVPSQIILITDGSTGTGEDSLQKQLSACSQSEPSDTAKKFAFPSSVQVMCLGMPSDPAVQTSLPLFETIAGQCGPASQVYTPEGALSMKSVQNMFTAMVEKNYSPFMGQLKCGHMECNIQLIPPPRSFDKYYDFQHVSCEVSKTIVVCGFLDMADLASPPHISRHLVLPVISGSSKEGDEKTEKGDGDEPEGADDGKLPTFTVLLHGSLKVEATVGLVQLGKDWYGILYSWADSKKKSNLMLSIFQPGIDILPWMGNLKHLAPCGDFADPPYAEDGNKSPFPVRPLDRRSYAQNCVSWIKQASLQADIQKVLRNARKLPEKQQHFYKELNRVRRAALSYGFLELLEALASLLERECTLLPGNAHPDAALQLSHAANSLRAEHALEYRNNIIPLSTNFAGDGGND